MFFCSLSDIFSTSHVNSIVKFFAFIFSSINSCVGSTVIDQGWFYFRKHFIYFVSISDVHFCHIYCYILFVTLVKKVTKFSSELTICTCY